MSEKHDDSAEVTSRAQSSGASWLFGGSSPEADSGEAAAAALAPLTWSASPTQQKLGELLEGGSEAISRLSSPALHRLANEIGLHDALDLLELASAEQIRDVLDLQVWSHDRVDLEELRDWLHALALLDDDARRRHFRGLDVELLGYLLRKCATIYLANVEDEPVPEEARGTFYPTPDGWFLLDLETETEAELEQVTTLLDGLYTADAEWARTLLQNLMWELPTELEEWSLRWRNGRLQDLGFADPLEAMAIYAPLDAESVRPDEATADRPLAADPEPLGELHEQALLSASGDATFWDQGLAQVDSDEERARLSTAALYVANRTLSADRVPPDDEELASEALRRLRGRLSLGLEELCAGDVQRAPATLAKVALSRIARVGHTLARAAATPLLPLARQGRLGRGPRRTDLLDAHLARRVQLLLAAQPMLADAEPPRPMASRGDVALARAWVEEACLAADLAPRESWPDALPDDTTLASIFRSSVVARALDAAPPFDAAAVERLRGHLAAEQPGGFDEAIAEAAGIELQERLGDATLPWREAAGRLAERWFAELAETLESIPAGEGVDLRFIQGLLLETPKDA